MLSKENNNIPLSSRNVHLSRDHVTAPQMWFVLEELIHVLMSVFYVPGSWNMPLVRNTDKNIQNQFQFNQFPGYFNTRVS